MDGPNVAGSQTDIWQDRRAWIDMMSPASSVQRVTKILRDLVIYIYI